MDQLESLRTEETARTERTEETDGTESRVNGFHEPSSSSYDPRDLALDPGTRQPHRLAERKKQRRHHPVGGPRQCRSSSAGNPGPFAGIGGKVLCAGIFFGSLGGGGLGTLVRRFLLRAPG